MTKVSQDRLVTIAKILGADKLLPCVLLIIVLSFLYYALLPMFTATNETFKDYVEITEKRLVVEERIAKSLDRLCRRQFNDLPEN